MVVSINKPLISIIVPIYNVEAYLGRCLDSLVSQTYKNIEIILVNDGSTDFSGAIADKYAKAHNNIIIVHKSNGGLSSARNIGLELARGEWLAFVDSDDYVNENFISKLFELARKNNADIATCSNKSISYDETPLKTPPRWPSETLSGHEAIKQTFIHGWTSHIWLNLFRADIFKKNHITFPEGKEYESVAVKIKALYFANKVTFTNEKLYTYVSRKGSITYKKVSKTLFNDKLAALHDINTFLENEGSTEVSSFFNYYAYHFLAGILNDIIKKRSPSTLSKETWHAVRKQLIVLYPKVRFPDFKQRLIHSLLLLLSSSQTLYRFAYNKLLNYKQLSLNSSKHLSAPSNLPNLAAQSA